MIVDEENEEKPSVHYLDTKALAERRMIISRFFFFILHGRGCIQRCYSSAIFLFAGIMSLCVCVKYAAHYLISHN